MKKEVNKGLDDKALRAKIRFIHDKHYISENADDNITDSDVNSAIEDTLALVKEQQRAYLEQGVISEYTFNTYATDDSGYYVNVQNKSKISVYATTKGLALEKVWKAFEGEKLSHNYSRKAELLTVKEVLTTTEDK